jgi:hypothetical protein
MAWFKVDDGFYSSPKVLSIRRADRLAALGLWVTAGTWAAKHLTDGAIPSYMLEEFGANVSHGDILVTAGLWRADGESYVFHDWSDYQPMKRDVMANRERERQRKESYRKKASTPLEITGQSPIGTSSPSPNGTQTVSGHPDPTRPDPTPSSKEERAAKRGSRIPEDFTITDEMREWASTETPLVDVDRKLPEFIDYWRGVSGQKGVKLNWPSTWRNSMRKQQGFAERDQQVLGNPDSWMNRSQSEVPAWKRE